MNAHEKTASFGIFYWTGSLMYRYPDAGGQLIELDQAGGCVYRGFFIGHSRGIYRRRRAWHAAGLYFLSEDDARHETHRSKADTGAHAGCSLRYTGADRRADISTITFYSY